MFQSSREAHSPRAKERFLFFATSIHLFNIKERCHRVMPCVLIFRGHTMIFRNLMLYPSRVPIQFSSLKTHTGSRGCVCVCTQQSVYNLGAMGKRRCCIRTRGHCPLEQTATVMVAGTNIHPWPGCYRFLGDFPHL